MRKLPGIPVLLILLILLTSLPAEAGDVKGTIKVGAIGIEEESGDISTVPEMFDIYDGFNVSHINLAGKAGGRNTFYLDLREANLDSRRGVFSYRIADLGKLTVRHDQTRQIYDAAGSVASERKNWNFGAHFTPNDWLRITGDHSIQSRDGNREGFPVGTASALGGTYDYTFKTGYFEAEGRKDGRMLAVGWETSRLQDDLNSAFDRTGNVVSLRASAPCLLSPRLTHFVRASYGKQELDEAGLDYTLSTFEYLGMVRLASDIKARYRLGLNRVDNTSTDLQTDLVRNDVDLTWYHAHGNVTGGYGRVTNDDDRSLTDSNDWRLGAVYAQGNLFKAKVGYAASERNDQESLTLLKDVESNRLRASLEGRPHEDLTLGVSYVERDRDYPVLGVSANGKRYGANGRLELAGLGSVSVDFTYADDRYTDRAGSFRADNATVAGRVDVDAVENLRLTGGVTYLDLGQDLDIEKSVLSFEGQYTFNKDYFVEVKYNVYNYDDYILLDRYYTANVVWLNVGYNLSID